MKTTLKTTLKTSNGVEIQASECDNLAHGYKERFDWLRVETGVSRPQYYQFLLETIEKHPDINLSYWSGFPVKGYSREERQKRLAAIPEEQKAFFGDWYFYSVLRCVFLFQQMEWQKRTTDHSYRTYSLKHAFEDWYGRGTAWRAAHVGGSEYVADMQVKLAAYLLKMPGFRGGGEVPVTSTVVWRVLDHSSPEGYGMPPVRKDSSYRKPESGGGVEEVRGA